MKKAVKRKLDKFTIFERRTRVCLVWFAVVLFFVLEWYFVYFYVEQHGKWLEKYNWMFNLLITIAFGVAPGALFYVFAKGLFSNSRVGKNMKSYEETITLAMREVDMEDTENCVKKQERLYASEKIHIEHYQEMSEGRHRFIVNKRIDAVEKNINLVIMMLAGVLLLLVYLATKK